MRIFYCQQAKNVNLYEFFFNVMSQMHYMPLLVHCPFVSFRSDVRLSHLLFFLLCRVDGFFLLSAAVVCCVLCIKIIKGIFTP